VRIIPGKAGRGFLSGPKKKKAGVMGLSPNPPPTRLESKTKSRGKRNGAETVEKNNLVVLGY